MPPQSAEGTRFVCQSHEIWDPHTGVAAHPSALGCDTGVGWVATDGFKGNVAYIFMVTKPNKEVIAWPLR